MTIGNCAHWPSCISAIIALIGHHAYLTSCLLAIVPIGHRAYQPSCRSAIVICSSSIIPIGHNAQPTCPSTTETIDHHAYQQSGLLSRLLSLSACLFSDNVCQNVTMPWGKKPLVIKIEEVFNFFFYLPIPFAVPLRPSKFQLFFTFPYHLLLIKLWKSFQFNSTG